MLSVPAAATDYFVTGASTVTNGVGNPPVLVGIGDRLTVNPNASIVTAGAAQFAINLAEDEQQLTNFGLIEAQGAGGIPVWITNADLARIQNYGTIQSSASGERGVYIQFSDDVVLDNYGLISTDLAFGRAVEVFQSTGFQLNNYGRISTAANNSVAVLSGLEDTFILNDGLISTTGDFSRAIAMVGARNSTIDQQW